MSRTKALEKVKLTRFDDLFGGKEEPVVEAGEVKQIPISELHEFHNHPFQIRSDEELEEMIESVRQHGVLVPGIVRSRKEGGYEIIAGHTRRHVCELLGIDTMPVFVKDLDDNEASLIMVDSNIQRENILPSEKARAYKIKYDAMKNQGKEGNSLQKMSEESGENYKSIQRYIWLARLNDNLLGMVDNKKLGFIQGVSLSVLSNKEQEMVYDAICRYEKKLSTVQANTIKQLSADGKLDEETLERYLFSVERHSKKKDITLKNEDGSEMVITKFDLAVNRRNKHEGNADADFFHCTSFGRQAEFVEKYFHSGSRVLVVGRVQNNNYTTKEGNKVYGFSIITEEVEFAQKKSAGKAAADADDFSYAADEQVPFESR